MPHAGKFKIISTCLVGFGLLSVYSAYPASDNTEDIDPSLARELSKAGINPAELTDKYNFVDGNFELSQKLTQAINGGLLFQNDPALREELRKSVRTGSLVLSPWDMSDNVSVVTREGNSFAELRAAPDKDVYLGQAFIFKTKNAELDFVLSSVDTGSYDKLEVKAADAAVPEGLSEPREVVLGTYLLANISGKTALSIDLSRNKKFQDFLASGPDRLISVTFHFVAKSAAGKMRLDNIKVAYNG